MIKIRGMKLEHYLATLPLHLAPVLCVFFAAYLQAVTGFGLVIVAAPLLMFFYDPKLVIPVMILLASCGNVSQTLLLHRDIHWRIISFLILGAILGQPIGFQIFSLVPSHYLKILISVVVLLSLSIMQLRHQHIRECRRNTLITGMLAGIMATTTGMAGPPVAIYFAYTTMTIKELRATSIGFFFLSNMVSLTTFLVGGVDMAPAFNEFIYLLPGLIGGIILGQLTFRFLPVPLLKKVIFGLMYFTCFYTIYTVIR